MTIDGLALQELREIVESIAEQSDGDWLGADDARLILALMDERDVRIDGDADLSEPVEAGLCEHPVDRGDGSTDPCCGELRVRCADCGEDYGPARTVEAGLPWVSVEERLPDESQRDLLVYNTKWVDSMSADDVDENCRGWYWLPLSAIPLPGAQGEAGKRMTQAEVEARGLDRSEPTPPEDGLLEVWLCSCGAEVRIPPGKRPRCGNGPCGLFRSAALRAEEGGE